MILLPTRTVLDGRFRLRPLRAADAEPWFRIVADPRVHGPTSWAVTTLAEMEVAVARRVAAGGRWAVERVADGLFVGTCGAGRWEPETGTAEVAYELAPEVWGLGLATAAVQAFVDTAGAAGMVRMEAHTWVQNHASARVLERSGFVREALLVAFRDCRGEPRDFWRWGRRLGDGGLGATGRA